MPAAAKRLTPWVAAVATVMVACAFAYVMAQPRSAPTAAVPGLAVGDPAPEFTLPDLDGKPVSLASLKGHVVVLDLWATWCPPCVAELPTNTAVAAKYAGQGVQFYAVSVSDTPAAVRSFLARQKLQTPVLIGGDSDVAQKYAAEYIPLLVVIDAHGKIVARDNVAPEDAQRTLSGWIEKALKSGQAA